MRLRLLILLILAFRCAAAQFTVQVQVNVVQPVPPYLPQIKADIAGNRAGRLNEDISNHLSIVLRYTGHAQQRIKLAGSIERVSPSPMGVSLRPDYQPAQALVMGPSLPILSLNKDLLQTAFGNFSENSLVWNNLDLNTLRQNGIDYKLPEGVYRVCVTAYDYDRPGFSFPLSAPGTGCAYFTICYTAAAPQLLLPVSTMTQSTGQFNDFTPRSTQVQFLWTPPATTCGVPIGALNYDLEIRRVFEGQTVTDAQANPYVFHQQNIPTTSFFLDTLRYPHILVPGQKYTIRVRANFFPRPGSPLEIANNGYSQIAGIDYKANTGGPFNGMVTVIKKPEELPGQPVPPGSTILPGGYIVESYTPNNGGCPAGPVVSNTTSLTTDISGTNITLGNFQLHVDQATTNNDGSYRGNGYVIWHPFATDIHLKVNFDTLRVNTDRAVFGGRAYTATDGTHPEWSPFGLTDPITKLTGLDNSGYESLRSRISDGAHLVSGALGNDEVDFPLGLNTTLGGTPATMAIMGISFMSSCTNMNILFNVNCPDLGGWLSLGGTGLQIDPGKLLLPGAGGVLYLPQDHQLSLAGMNFSFDGCPGTGSGSVDTSKGTYVRWDGNTLSDVVVIAHWQPNSSSLVAVDATDKRLATPLSFQLKFAFSSWNDWTAAVTPASNFEIAALPGFAISSTGGFYDHSDKQNPAGISFPAGYGTTPDASWNGLYIPSLTMHLPPDFLGDTDGSFSFQHFLLDNTGVSTLISADNILTTGIIGGWAFSIDHLGIGIVHDNPQTGMQMSGGIQLPLSTTPLGYTCNLSAGEGAGLNYQFVVTPKGDYSVPMWAANLALSPASSLTINDTSGSFVIRAQLAGNVSISTAAITSDIPNINFTLLSFQGMTLTNKDPNTGGFGFDPGNWSADGKSLPHTTALEPTYDGYLTGPSANMDGLPTIADAASTANETAGAGASPAGASDQGTADGFSLNLTGFKPYVNLSGSSASIGVTFTVNAVLDESGFGIGGSATLDIFGNVSFPTGKPPQIDATPHINLDSVAVDCNVDLFHVTGKLGFKRNDATFGDDVKGAISLTFLQTFNIEAGGIFGHVNNYNYWGLAAQVFWEQGIEFPPGLSINGFGGGFHYNMQLNDAKAEVKSGGSALEPMAVVNRLSPQQGTLGFNAAVIMAFLSPNVVVMESGLAMDFSSSNGLEKMEVDGTAHIMSAAPPDGDGMLNANMTATYVPDPGNFNCTLDVDGSMGIFSGNIPMEFNVGADGNYFYLGTPAPPGTAFDDPAIKSMVIVEMGFDARVIKVAADVYAYFDIGDQLPASPYVPPAIMNVQDHNGNPMGAGVIKTFSGFLGALQGQNQAGKSHSGTVPDPGFMVGAGLHLQADVDLAVVSANGSLDIGFAVLMEHFNPTDIDKTCSPDGTIGFHNWYAMGTFYADLNADLNVGPITVGSVNAGAILAAGLINPTWAEGDVWIDVHVLGVISFTGNCTISIGNPCRPTRDPLEDLQMIGDFGPRTKDGSPVDVTSIPYVIGNVPLNQDYPVLMPDGSTKTYQFRVDVFDVSTNGGQPIGATTLTASGEYEKDLYHYKMLCGNAGYNAHLRVSAYQVSGKDADPNKALLTQDTTYVFTTGPRPATIQGNNLAYAYPVANQRYLLKSEFNSQGRLGVAQDISYLLNGGQVQQCDDPTPSTTAPAAKKSAISSAAILKLSPKLLAKFIPFGGGDTLQSSFTYNYNSSAGAGTLQFPLPANLLNNKVYTLMISVVPQNFDIKPQVAVTTQNKTVTQTSTSYSMNTNGNLVAQTVVKNVTVTETTHQGNGNRQMANVDTARVIYQIAFETSRFDRLSDKMAAYGTWQGQDETSFALKMPVYSSASGAEPFDEFEIHDFWNTCTSCQSGPSQLDHLFTADIPFSPSGHNDQEMVNLYSWVGAVVDITNAQFDLGRDDLRTLFDVPETNLVSFENMPWQPQLDIRSPFFLTQNFQQQQLNTSGPGIAGLSYTLPAQQAATGGGRPQTATINTGYGMNYNYAFGGAPAAPAPPKPQPGLLWIRDNVYYNDFTLIQNFARDLLTQKDALTAQALIDLAEFHTGTVLLQENGYYGNISMTAEDWIRLLNKGNVDLLWQDAATLASLPFTPFPPNAGRPITFGYRFPQPYSGVPTDQVGGVFNYKMIVSPSQPESIKLPQGAAPITVSQKKASGQTTTPAAPGSMQVRQVLSNRYNLK